MARGRRSVPRALRRCACAAAALPKLQLFPDAISKAEEQALVEQVTQWFAGKPYESGHFDGVASHYRELQKGWRRFSPQNRTTLERLRDTVVPADTPLLPVHVLDLHADGEIRSHVDHVEYSGRFIVGLSLLSDAVMTLRHEQTSELASVLLPRRSMYLMADAVRYEWAHAILAQEKGRRVTLLFRDRAADDVAGV